MSNFIPNRGGESFKPRLVSSDPSHGRREMAASVLPQHATLAANSFGHRQGAGFFGGNMPMGVSPVGGGGGGSAAYHMQRPYLPGVESPDRVQFPKSRLEANRAWRLFHETDPIFGTAIDMYAEMLVSDFDIIVGDEKSREIKDTLEYMCQECTLVDRLKYIIREYLVMGESIPHCFFDDTLGIWTYIALHNPDYIDIVDTPIVNMDPIINFVPDEDLRRLMSDGSPESREFRSRLPTEFVSKIMARQKIRLSPLNCSFIARKLHPYQVRGTSLASRMWRIFMVEDAVYNSTIATYRRHAAPVKVIKLGDPATGWIPAPGAETKLLDMLNRAEIDPQSWLVYHYGINFEAWGTTDRAITIDKQHDVIERVKLLALGLSKSFMTGEVTYACSLYDTTVRRADGSYGKIEEIEEGDLVADRFGQPKRVTETLKYPSPEEMVEITLYGKRKLTLTDNHALPVFARPRTCQCGCGGELWDEKQVSQGRRVWRSFLPMHHKNSERAGRDRTWIEYKHDDQVIVRFPETYQPVQRMEASQVKKGDWLMIPRTFERSDTAVDERSLERARLLGYYTAEGSVQELTEKSAVSRFSFGRADEGKEKFYVKDSLDVMERAGYKSTLRFTKNGLQTIYLHSSASRLSFWFIEHAGQGSATKCFSEEVMGWDLELKKELLKGMYRGDGYVFKKEDSNRLDIVYATVSDSLSTQLELILAQLGFACYIHTTEKRVDKNGYLHKPCHYVTVAGKQAKPLAELVWGDVPEVWDNLDFTGFNEGTQGERFEVFKDDEYLYIPVTETKVIEVDREKHPYVYSLTVEDTHSYTLENIASFNSAKSGLQVFLRRLLSLRQFLENVWLYPKFFRPISEINDWTTSSPSEVNHKYRIKRTAQEIQEQNLILMPTLKWRNKLDPSVDLDLLNAYKMLEQGFGIKLSKTTVSSPVGIDWLDEQDKSLKEFKTSEDLKEKTLGKALLDKYEQQGGQQPPAAPPGTPGGGAKPPGAMGKPPGGMAPGGAPGGGLQLGQGMDDASRPPGSGDGGGAMDEGIAAPSGGGLPTGIG